MWYKEEERILQLYIREPSVTVGQFKSYLLTYYEAMTKLRLKCNYYIPESLNKTETSNQQNQFSVMCLNIRSISNKFDMFKQLIKSTKENFQIIGLTETWLGDENYKNFNLEGYDFISMHRSGKKGGGV
jgi:hypothetical protein